MGRRRERRKGSVSAIVSKLAKQNYGLMRLLFETPSGFAIFSFSEVYFYLPHALERIWSKFDTKNRASFEVFLEEFQTFEDKSSTINAVTGVSRQLADMINRWCLSPRMKLGVGKPEYKMIIESKLGIPCVYNEIRELVPQEKSELTKEDRLPMSQGLKQLLSRYGFDIKPDMVNEKIVLAACALCDCDGVYRENLTALRQHALKVLVFPEEEIDFPEMFAQDELSKLKGDAPKYKGIMPEYTTLIIYKEIVSAHHVRIAKTKLLGSLVKEAMEAREAEHAEVYEKGKRLVESEQIPQEHVFFVNLCRMILPVIYASNPSYMAELPLQKVLKRSWDSAFEPVVVNKSIFGEGSSLGETLSRRIARRSSSSGPQPSTSKTIVPYKPVLPAVLLSFWAESQSQNIENIDSDHKINVGKSILARLTEPMEQVRVLGIGATPLASVGKALTAEHLAEHSEQNEVNILENVHQSEYDKSSRQHVKLEDAPCNRPKKSAAPSSSSLSLDN